ncbi:TRAP transporter small permease [Solibacillus sp. FSL W8-0474]|uniref:TRAP transporter small permease n=1 Tax=Solibacillus sp. FSL W8-0474 TaxID=2975336 RepID=UPI0030FA5B0E
MSTFDKVYSYFGKVKKVTLFISGISIAIMILLISLDVILRNLFSYGLPGSYEITESILMPTVIFWGLLVTYSSGSIPRLDMLSTKLNGKAQLIVGIMMILIDIFIYSTMAFYALNRAITAMTDGAAISAGGTLISIAIIFAFVPISFLLVTIEAIFILVKSIKDKKVYYSVDNENEAMQE